MTRTATASLCAIVLIALTLYRYTRIDHVLSSRVPEAASKADGSEMVLPPVSDVWSNLPVKASVSPLGTQNVSLPLTSLTSTSGVVAAISTPPVPNSTAVGARAKELLARVGLASVGLDSEAEQYWVAAISDPNVSADERHELIQALSEAGFSDPRHVTADDLPLIASRIALIEELAPSAIDAVNTAAFQETYRDLLNMFGSLTETPQASQTAGE